jgi:hypothetical protein
MAIKARFAGSGAGVAAKLALSGARSAMNYWLASVDRDQAI